MKRHQVTVRAAVMALSLLAVGSASAATLGTAFIYQGRLTAGGAPAQGEFDLRLTLFDAMAGGNAVGLTLTNENVVVSNGLFHTGVDFGPGIFNGDTYWMEVAVRPGGSASNFGAPLLPRQPVLGTPYALYAVNAEQVNGLGADAFWKLGGNTGAVAGTDYLGTTDREDLEFRVGDTRALRLQYHATAPSVVGGSANNNIPAGALGAAIGGGDNNAVGGDYGSVGGGQDNVLSNTADYGTIPGGRGAGASNYGQLAYASGSFTASGDAQTSVYVLRGSTSLAGPVTELFLDGAGERMGLARDSAWTFDVQVVASAANGWAGGFEAKGVVKREGAVTSLVGRSTPIFATAIALEGGSWAVSIDGNDTLDALTVTVTGDTFQEVRWVATVRATELQY